MNSGTIIVTLVFFAVIFIPLGLLSYNKKRKKTKLLLQFKDHAASEGYSVTKHEVCCNMALGIDETKSHLLFYKQTDDSIVTKNIDLQQYKNCKLNNHNRNVGDKSSNFNVIYKIELILTPIQKQNSSATIELFNAEKEQSTVTGELQFGEKWENILNDFFNSTAAKQ